MPTSAQFPLPTRRLRSPSHAAWLGARASNVRRRGGRLAAAALLSFGGVLGLYALLPSVSVAGRVSRAQPATDTVALIAARTKADVSLLAADSALEIQRAALQFSEISALRVLDSLNATVPATYSDSLILLDRLVARAASSPLLANYEALGRAPFMRDDARARALLDSVVLISSRRDSLQNQATVDSTFVSLTSLLNELGRSLRTVAQVRARALRSASPTAAPPPLPESAGVDTLSAATARDAARRAVIRTEGALTLARDRARENQRTLAARASTTESAPLSILILAAALLSVVGAFVTVLALEMRHPKLADAAEAERETGQRVIAQVSHDRPHSGRRRRAADADVSPVLSPARDEYRLLSDYIAAQWPRDGIVTITGDRAAVTAVVAANIAAVLATEAHATLLVDEDFAAEPVRRVLHVRRVGGLAAALENRRRWAESLVTISVGRGRTLEVLPSGSRERTLGPEESQALVGEVNKAARRYDATVVVAPPGYAVRARAGDDVVVCAVRGGTPLRGLVELVAALTDGGAKVRGLVLWEGALPRLQGN